MTVSFAFAVAVVLPMPS
jgi:hypothetical protein